MEREEFLKEIIRDHLEAIIQLSIQGDYAELETWLTPIFRDHYKNESLEDLRETFGFLMGDQTKEDYESICLCDHEESLHNTDSLCEVKCCGCTKFRINNEQRY